MIDAELLDAIERATENAIAEIAALRAALAGREAEIEVLTTVCDERQDVITRLQAASEERLAIIERLTHDAQLLTLEVERLKAETAAAPVTAQTGDGIDWKAVATERGNALESVSIEAERRASLLVELTDALKARTEEVEELRRDRARSS